MRPISFRADQTPEIKFPVTSVLPNSQNQQLLQMPEMDDRVVYSNTPGTFQFSNEYLEQPSQKKFNADNIYKYISLGATLILTVFVALSLKPLIENPFKHSAKNLFENFKDNDKIIPLSKLPGMEQVKREFRQKVINPMKYRDMFVKEHLEPGMMCILHGPPGTGKTNFVKSSAKEVNAYVASFSLSKEGSEYMYKTSKNMASKADAIYKYAKRHSDKEIFVLFDEVEAILSEVKDASSDSALSRQEVIKTFLSILDKFNTLKNIRVFATTNQELNLKTGMIGNMNKAAVDRFATKIYVGNPDAEAITNALKLYFGEHPSAKEFVANKEKMAYYGRRLEGYSFRNIVQIKDSVMEILMAKKIEVVESGKNPDTIKLTDDIFETAIRRFARSKNKFELNDSQQGSNRHARKLNILTKIVNLLKFKRGQAAQPLVETT